MRNLKPLKKLVDTRVDNKMTQDDLAARAKISRGMLSNIERGYTLPSLPVAYRIAKELKSSIEYLFFNEDVQNMNKKDSKTA